MKRRLFDVLRSVNHIILVDTVSCSGVDEPPTRHRAWPFVPAPEHAQLPGADCTLEFQEGGEDVQFHFPDQDVEIDAEGAIQITDEYEGTYTLLLSMFRPMNAADVQSSTPG